MYFDRFLRASAFVAILAVSPVAAQETEHHEHHPDTAITPPASPVPRAAEPAQGAMPGAAERGAAMDHGEGMQPGPGARGGHDMAMMRECMGMMGSMMRGMGPGDTAATAPDDPVDGAFAAINRRMHRDMAIPAGGNPDAAFAQAMIAHHQGAIDMARVILGFGSDPEIRKLAEGIIAAQQSEIAILGRWLARQPKP